MISYVVGFGRISTRAILSLMVVSSAYTGFGVYSEALAQECHIKKLDEGGRANDIAQANFTCLTAKLTAALSRIEILEAELAPFKNAKGAVVAFDRNRATQRVCPKGWTEFKPAGGRLVVGAGQHDNDLSEYPSFVEDNTQSVGGEERVKLGVHELPAHEHEAGTLSADTNTDSLHVNSKLGTPLGGAGNLGVPLWGSSTYTANKGAHGHSVSGSTGMTGDTKPHNNMPPYIALYFCKKD